MRWGLLGAQTHLGVARKENKLILTLRLKAEVIAKPWLRAGERYHWVEPTLAWSPSGPQRQAKSRRWGFAGKASCQSSIGCENHHPREVNNKECHVRLKRIALEVPMCKVFPSSIGDIGLKWFDKLPAWSIRSFYQLIKSFVAQFIINIKASKGVSSLLMPHKGKSKSLPNYSKRYWEFYN